MTKSQNTEMQCALERAQSFLEQRNPLHVQTCGMPSRTQVLFPGWSVVVQSGNDARLDKRGLHWALSGYFSGDDVTREKSEAVRVETKLSIRKHHPDARGTEADIKTYVWELVRYFDTSLSFETAEVSEALNNFQNDLCRARALLGDKSAAASTTMSGYKI